MASLTEKELKIARKQVEESVRPLIFFHDDPDGLSSYLLLRRKIGDGKGIPIKTTPIITTDFLRFVKEWEPDRLFIVDIAIVEQDFLDEVGVPVTWIDHHSVLDRDRVSYFNPRRHTDKNIPASQVCYDIVEQDDWIGVVGVVGDWVLTDLTSDYAKEHPEMLSPETDKPEDALFGSKIGELTNMFSFLLKGKMKDVRASMAALEKIESAEELYFGESDRARKLRKRFDPILAEYKTLLSEALEKRSDDPVLEHIYGDNKWSFTKEVSNEVYYNNPDKLVVIGRDHGGLVKLSMRYAGILPPIIEEALNGLEGRGGGHPHACGAVVNKEDYPEFIKRLRSLA